MIKSFGQMGDVDRVRELWKQMTVRGLQSGPLTFGCMADAHTSPGPWRVPPLDAKCVRGKTRKVSEAGVAPARKGECRL